MTLQEPTPRSFRETPSHVIQRLERNNRELLTLDENLRSYTCEPKTYSLFERCQQLKNRLEEVRGKNQEIITALRERKRNMDGQMEEIRQQIREYRELELLVLEYIGMARMHN